MRCTARLAVLAAVAALVLPGSALAGYDALDGSFGQLGIARTVHPGNDEARAITIDTFGGGGILTAGGSALDDPSRPGATALTLVRLGDDGSPDTSFGDGNGIVQTDTGRQSARFEAVDVDDQGRIVAVGTTTGFDGIDPNVVVARYLDDGSPDTSFGEEGILTLGGDQPWVAEDAVLQGDDIVILALSGGAGGPRPTVVRLTETGARDSSFGVDGQKRFLSHKLETASSIAVDGSRLVLAGTSASGDFAAAWLDADGTAPSGIADSGYARVQFPGASDATEVAVDPEGRVILGGHCSCKHRDIAAVARLSTSGEPDKGFSDDGRTTIHLGGRGAGGTASALTWMPRGKVAVGVDVSGRTGRRSAIVRLKSNGRLDRAFSADGISSPGFRTQAIPGYRGDAVEDIVMDPRLRLVAAATLFTEDSDFLVARFVP